MPDLSFCTPNATSCSILNFAYGSNMLTARICDRVPSARALGVAILLGHQLRWHKASKDGSGKCDVVATAAEDSVYGVLYELALTEKASLDRAEGLGSGYSERQVEVIFHGRKMLVSLYYATAINSTLKPYYWYKELVIAGARQHGLPPEYIHMLESEEAIEDTNLARHAENVALLKSAGQT
ncbi:hypothetical protein WT77_23160 [Burkholderia stagnalis]|nr:hypothetical protein WT77_23160 [Burkholderia stagnalis]